MEWLGTGLYYAAAFFFIISVIVFIHEYGHYIVARWCGVKVEQFSIGFGKEIWGWNDKAGTRWKISLLPMGGYVKMFGDADAASTPDNAAAKHMTEEEKSVAFVHKSLAQKSAVVAAGPAANFVLAIVILTGFFMAYGRPETPPVVGEVVAESAAAEAGLQTDDIILTIDGRKMERFADIQRIVRMHPAIPMAVTVQRGEEMLSLTMIPQLKETEDMFGNVVSIGLLGVTSGKVVHQELGFGSAVVNAVEETFSICTDTLAALGQMIVGERSLEELGGPIKIAKYSGQSVEQGWKTVLWFMALLSINLGLINLFPIPMLDGGHLLFYGIQAIIRRPVPERVQEYAFRAGFALIITLMVFTTVNDIWQLV